MIPQSSVAPDAAHFQNPPAESACPLPGYRFDAVESTNASARRLMQIRRCFSHNRLLCERSPNAFALAFSETQREGAMRNPFHPSWYQDAFFVTAHEQFAGRGTRGKAWCSPRNAGMYLSVCHVAGNPPWSISIPFTTMVAIACASALQSMFDIEINIKPPNDLLFQGAKLCGILSEAEVESGAVAATIVGIGVNTRIAHRPVSEAALPPISLEEAIGSQKFAVHSARELELRIVRAVHEAHENAFAAKSPM